MNDVLTKKVLTAAFLIETFCVTYALKFPTLVPIATIVYFLSGILIAWMILFLPQATIQKGELRRMFTFNGYKFLILGMMGVMMIHFTSIWMTDNPLIVKDGDMLPVIKVMSQRFLQGKWNQVYAIIPAIWGGMKPIYLPTMWLPFSIPVALQSDVRWTTVGVLFLVFSVFIFLFKPHKKEPLKYFLILTAFTLFWWLFTDETAGLVTYTEEGVVILYYVLLVLALFKGNYWLVGLAISLCALSRYAFAGWIPAMFVFLLLEKQFLNMGKLIISGTVCLFLFVLLPFGWGVISNTMQLPGEYIHFAARVWHDMPIVFSSSLGFSKFFGPGNIALQHQLLLGLSFIIPTVFVGFCWWFKVKQHKNLSNIPLAALKLTMVLFYSFIDVPYLYLFYTSSFVSLILVTFFLMQKNETDKAYSNPGKMETML
jgi:hypothetical protein